MTDANANELRMPSEIAFGIPVRIGRNSNQPFENSDAHSNSDARTDCTVTLTRPLAVVR